MERPVDPIWVKVRKNIGEKEKLSKLVDDGTMTGRLLKALSSHSLDPTDLVSDKLNCKHYKTHPSSQLQRFIFCVF